MHLPRPRSPPGARSRRCPRRRLASCGDPCAPPCLDGDPVRETEPTLDPTRRQARVRGRSEVDLLGVEVPALAIADAVPQAPASGLRLLLDARPEGLDALHHGGALGRVQVVVADAG